MDGSSNQMEVSLFALGVRRMSGVSCLRALQEQKAHISQRCLLRTGHDQSPEFTPRITSRVSSKNYRRRHISYWSAGISLPLCVFPFAWQRLSSRVLAGQTFEGGISGSPNTEAHGAYAFCALACLCIIGDPRKMINESVLLRTSLSTKR